MLLSIIVPTVHTRYDSFRLALERELYRQYDDLSEVDKKKVEIIVFSDTKSFVLGKKRDMLYKLSHGEYSVQLDDDDRVAEDYIQTILDVLKKSKPDVIAYDMQVRIRGSLKRTRVSIKNKKDTNTREEYLRIPSYQMVVKTELARKIGAIDKIFGEDADFSKQLLPLLKTEHKIDRILYYYDFDEDTSETYAHRKYGEVVDVVFLSKALNQNDAERCQKAINSCIKGAGKHKVNIIVIEQNPDIKYENVDKLIHKTDKFNYNGFANFGAKQGNASWIMIANNDLTFGENWFKPLVEAESELVSPHNPQDIRQQLLAPIESGTINGRHLSGWCFMIHRKLWEKMGGFDDDVEFWCSDDVVIEQAIKLGVEPTIVTASVVEHTGSETLDRLPEREDMKWKSVYIFNKKYNRNKFIGNSVYQDWILNHPKEVREIDEKFR